MSYVLWLTSWYPSRVQPSNGDFVERHAEAVSLHRKVVVLHIEKDASLDSGAIEVIETEKGKLTVLKVYYGKSRWGGWIGKWQSLKTYKKIQLEFYKKMESRFGAPELIHVHESMKAGLLALQLKQERGIPYILTTHWTGYQTKFSPNYTEQSSYWNKLNKEIITKADKVSTVSLELGSALEKYAGKVPLSCIYNVVDVGKFHPIDSRQQKFRFVHASYLNTQKNPEGIINAAASLQKEGFEFELVLIGREAPELETYGLNQGMKKDNFLIKSEIVHDQMAAELQNASALVMFSRFENMPCVILEALCCGLPVISTNVGGIAEVVDSTNGVLIENENEEELKEAMKNLLLHNDRFNRNEIALSAAAKCSYEVIGKKFDSLYRSIVTRS